MDRELYQIGFFDGEGCIFINKRYQYGRSKHPQYQVRMTIANTCYDVIKTFERSYGGRSAVGYPSKLLRRTSKPYWGWYREGSTAVEIIKKWLPYFIVKRKQAELAIEFQNFKETFSGKGKRISSNNFSEMEKFKQRMNILNAKGTKAKYKFTQETLI